LFNAREDRLGQEKGKFSAVGRLDGQVDEKLKELDDVPNAREEGK
jgi:hypothetical protein